MTLTVKQLFLILLCALGTQMVWGQNQSKLADGNWFKIGVTEDGLYRLDATVFDRLGLVNSFNPHFLHLYGNATGILPQPNDADRPEDLLENLFHFVGDEDEVFEPNEYYVFYGKSPHNLTYDGIDWQYQHNIYSDTAYYFLTVTSEQNTFIQSKSIDIQNPSIVDTDKHPTVYAPKETNLLQYVNSGGSGRIWYGDLLIPSTGLVKNYEFETLNLTDSIWFSIDVLGFSESQTTMDVLLNQNDLGKLQINASTISTYSPKGRPKKQLLEAVTSGERQDLTLDFIRADGSIYGFINEILVTYNRRLSYQNDPLFFNNQNKMDSEYQIRIASPSELTLWDISDPTTPLELESGFSNDILRFSDSASRLKKYVAFDISSITQRPFSFGSISNQNIRSLSPADGIIITAPAFKTEAQRLANHHTENDQLDVAVITTQEIYHEFSSGMQDVTAIRDAIRHYYLKNQDFRYVLLFGDCSFDYKNRVDNNTNLVPIYESYNSWDPVLSYASDDYYGFMEADEGEWRESQSGDHTLELGVGRLPVKSQSEAREMVDKIIKYAQSSAERGAWKNVMTYVVDDGNAGLTDTHTHMEDAEDFIDLLWQNHPQVEPKKLYIDAFPQEVTGGLENSETVRSLLNQSITEGTFMVNFIGHGSEQRWTEETVLDIDFIDELSNANQLPIFVTATCEFGRYDDPTLIAERGESGAEKLLLKSDGGAIALVTTTRPVYAFTNYDVNRAFHFFLMRPLASGPEAGKLPRLGDIIRETKNNSLSGAINRNFALLGDPMLRLDYPDQQIVIENINEQPLFNQPDTIQALEPIHIRGTVKDYFGNTDNTFNGIMEVKVYDTFSERLTLGQRDDPFPFKVRENVLYSGQASVLDGVFEVSFIAPKNISYQMKNGAITCYAYDPVKDLDATGGTNNILIGGTYGLTGTDDTPPQVSLSVDIPNFSNGSSVTRSDTLVANIFDESGINTTGLGLNRDITIEINGETKIINQLYQANRDDYQNGTIRYPLSTLEPGAYTATINLFDLHNNPADETVDFIVSDQPTIQLSDVRVYPNPVSDQFTVFLDHNRTDETLDISMEMISMNGHRVLKKDWVRTDFNGTTEELEVSIDDRWLQNGIYICKFSIISRLDGAIGMTTRRIVIIN